MPRNADWTREELILALDLYIREPRLAADPEALEVVALSAAFRKLGAALGREVSTAYRTPASVAMRASNWRSMNLANIMNGQKGFSHAGRLASEVWSAYSERPQYLNAVALRIFEEIQQMPPAFSAEVSEVVREDSGAEEGGLLTVAHMRRERNRALINRKKDAVLSLQGKLLCEACGDDGTRYAHRTTAIFEVHHRTPLSELSGSTTTKLSDLAIVCSNCHRAIHSTKPWATVEQLKGALRGS